MFTITILHINDNFTVAAQTVAIVKKRSVVSIAIQASGNNVFDSKKMLWAISTLWLSHINNINNKEWLKKTTIS